MADISEVLKRKSDRNIALKQLYEYWYENNGKAIRMNKDELAKERFLAYLYLADKGLINLELVNDFMLVIKITANGIDAVESKIQ